MRIIKITELSLDFVGKSIFNKAELLVKDEDHIGLVGPNGCGKSTFLKILLGEVIPDQWKLESIPNLRIGYLDQYADLSDVGTVSEYLHKVFYELYVKNDEVTKIYESISKLTEEEQMRAVIRAQDIIDYLNKHEFEQIDKKIDSVLAGLGFTETDKNKKVSELSGGMKTKLILAKLLLTEHDLLILDEPTNFLDIGYIAWLGEYLNRYKGAFIVISHDRAFLNKITNKIVEIANRKLKVYNGNYDYYLREKEIREAEQEKQYVAQEKFIAKAKDRIAQEVGTGISSSKSTWLKKMLATLEKIEKPDEIIKTEFVFQHTKGATNNILSAKSLSVGYNGISILPTISLDVQRGDKIVFRGFNGIGKTTLLKTLYGDLPPVNGSVEYGERIQSVFLRQEEDYETNFSHFDKHERKVLGVKRGKKREITVIEFAKEYYPEKSQKKLQSAMFSCGLNEKHFFNAVRTLSGGEMMKLRLCLAMLKPVNLIILDEPTNHLDMYSKEVLMHSLEEFPGTVLMTTHDVNADISWATKIINLEDLFV